jgi:hypothetical protein
MNISDWGWFMIAIIVITMCICSGLTIAEIKKPKPDPLAEQIISIGQNFAFSKEKEKLVSELIARYNPSNTQQKLEK